MHRGRARKRWRMVLQDEMKEIGVYVRRRLRWVVGVVEWARLETRGL